MAAIRAYAAGLLMVLRAPGIVIAAFLATWLAAIPFGLVLGPRLAAALASQRVSSQGAAEIDAEWWLEFRRHATGLEATFTPDVIGFAAPLSNLSALADGERRAPVLAVPIALYAVLWAALWGPVLERFLGGRRLGARGFLHAAVKHAAPLLMVGVGALAVAALLYATVHRLLFGPLFDWLASTASSERAAFFWRVTLYVLFAALLMVVTAVADFTRVYLVARQRTASPGTGNRVTRGMNAALAAVQSAMRLIRSRPATVMGLYLINAVIFAAALALYGTGEIVGGAHVGGWRAVAIGQAYIGLRIALRLALAASTVALTQKA